MNPERPAGHDQKEPLLALVKGHGAVALVVAAISLLLMWQRFPEIWAGELFGPDNYMRMVRIQELLESGRWYDHSIPRSNAPFGETLHWSRPLDLAILAGALIFLPFSTVPEAVFLSGVILSPVLLILILWGAGWIAAQLGGPRFRYFGMLAVLAQLGVVGYALPGRPDHHALILLCFVVATGAVLRGWCTSGPVDPGQGPPLSDGPGPSIIPSSRGSRRSFAVLAGFASALGLWTGPEFLVPMALYFGFGSWLWVVGGGRGALENLWFSGSAAMTAAVAVAVERPVGAWAVVELDKISAPHVLLLFMAFAFWGLVEATGWRWKRSLKRRALWIAGAVVAAGTVQAILFPTFFLGPTADVHPAVLSLWLRHVGDSLPILLPTSLVGSGSFLAFLGPTLFCIPFLVWKTGKGLGLRSAASRGNDDPVRAFFLLAGFLLFVPLALLQVRFAAYPELLIAPVTAWILSDIFPVLNEISRSWLRAAARAVTSASLITGFLFLGGVLMSLGGALPGGEGARGPATQATPSGSGDCSLAALAPFLNQPDGLGSRQRTVLSHVDFGPELLFRTRHRVLATPYHRNAQGILGAYEILSESDTEEARRLAAARGVDLVLLCEGRTSLYSLNPAQEGDGRPLVDRIFQGERIQWLRPVDLPSEAAPGFRLLQIAP